MAESGSPPRLSSGAVTRYALAFFGAHLAFIPLLVLLLPRRVESVVPDAATETLSLMLLAGGLVAGIAHILTGHVSDGWLARHGNRRGLIAIGTALITASYVLFAFAGSAPALFAAMIFFQIALNVCFAPLGALLPDHFPNAMKGRVGGLMNAALPASSLAIVPIAWAFPHDSAMAFLVTGGVAIACIVPLLARWTLGRASAHDTPEAAQLRPARADTIRDFAIAWLARLLIQLGAAFVIFYIYLYLPTVTGGDERASTEILGLISAPGALVAIAVALGSGLASDARGRRRVPLSLAALLFAGGLALLAAAQSLAMLLIAYSLFQIGLSAFLAIDTALVAQLVAGLRRRGMLLGVMNLTNTLPVAISPALALAAYDGTRLAHVLSGLFALCAAGAVLAAIMIALIRTVR